MLVIDGSIGEGGGQILRSSIAFSAITKTPVLIKNIRSSRPKPGLAAQHVTAINAVGQMCSAETGALRTGMTELEFHPQELTGGSFSFDIGTAGSITLVLQACLPVAISSPRPTNLDIVGGTDVKFSPPFDHFRYVLKPLIEKMGVGLEISFLQRGYYPKGGGRLKMQIRPPVGSLKHLDLEERGKFHKIRGIIHSANLPEHITDRIYDSALSILKQEFATDMIDIKMEKVSKSRSPGVGISIWADYDNTTIGSSALGERGVPAEKLGKKAARDLVNEWRSGATVDIYTADQLIPYIALAGGSIKTRAPISSHTYTNLNVIGDFSTEILLDHLEDKLIRLKNSSVFNR